MKGPKEEEEMDLQALEKLLKERRSIRKWKKRDLSDDLLKKAVELATWAPNGGNYILSAISSSLIINSAS